MQDGSGARAANEYETVISAPIRNHLGTGVAAAAAVSRQGIKRVEVAVNGLH